MFIELIKCSLSFQGFYTSWNQDQSENISKMYLNQTLLLFLQKILLLGQWKRIYGFHQLLSLEEKFWCGNKITTHLKVTFCTKIWKTGKMICVREVCFDTLISVLIESSKRTLQLRVDFYKHYTVFMSVQVIVS